MIVVDVVNAVEVVWWPVCGVLVLSRSRNARFDWKRLGMVSGITLILFGGSDVVELWTKAWWRPWWLLVWKAACIWILVAAAVIRLVKLRRDKRIQSSATV